METYDSAMMNISLDQVPEYLREGDYFKAMSEGDGDDLSFPVPVNVVKSDTRIASTDELVHLLRSLRFWIVSGSAECIENIFQYLASIKIDNATLEMLKEFEISQPFLHVVREICGYMFNGTVDDEDEDSLPRLVFYVACRNPCAVPIVLHLIKYAPVRTSAATAAEYDQLILEYLGEYNVNSVAAVGDLELLKCFYEHSVASDLLTYPCAQHGHVDCLKYLVSVGCEIEDGSAAAAAANGHVEVLKYLQSIRAIVDEECLNWAVENGHLECAKFLHSTGQQLTVSNACSAAWGGNLSCLMYLLENECPVDTTVTATAAEGGHLVCLQYLREQGCPWEETCCFYAAENGHLACLMYAHDNGCPWGVRTCKAAASGGHLDCLQYAHTNDCWWSVFTCSAAAKGGHLNCLQYAFDNGCPWNEYTCMGAATEGHISCLKYALENGCPYTTLVYTQAVDSQQHECAKYLLDKGYA